MKTQVTKLWMCLIAAGTLNIGGYAQNVGINANGVAPDNSAMLDVDVSALPANNKKGMLIPRVALTSNTDVATIPSPANSLVVYNTNASMTNGNGEGFYYWDAAASKWMYMATASNGPGSAGQVLTSTGAGSKPQWSTISVSSGGGGPTGCANCISMVSNTTWNSVNWITCANNCRTLTEGGYNDWRMPTFEEAIMYRTNEAIPAPTAGFNLGYVWTSTPVYYNLTGYSGYYGYWLVFYESTGDWYRYTYSSSTPGCRCVR